MALCGVCLFNPLANGLNWIARWNLHECGRVLRMQCNANAFTIAINFVHAFSHDFVSHRNIKRTCIPGDLKLLFHQRTIRMRFQVIFSTHLRGLLVCLHDQKWILASLPTYFFIILFARTHTLTTIYFDRSKCSFFVARA